MNVGSFNQFRSFIYIKDLQVNDAYIKCHPIILRDNVILIFGLEGVRRMVTRERGKDYRFFHSDFRESHRVERAADSEREQMTSLNAEDLK
jgi:hypothetical protein